MSRDDYGPPGGGDWRDKDEPHSGDDGRDEGYGDDGYGQGRGRDDTDRYGDDPYGDPDHVDERYADERYADERYGYEGEEGYADRAEGRPGDGYPEDDEPASRGPALLIGGLAALALAAAVAVYILVTQDSSDTDAAPTTPPPTVTSSPQPAPTPTDTPEPTETVEPTETDTPTETEPAEPTQDPTETATETETAEPTDQPTDEPTEEPTETEEPTQQPDSLALGVGTIGDFELPAAGSEVLAYATSILGEESDLEMGDEHLGMACLDLGLSYGDNTEFERSSWMKDAMQFMIEGPVVDGEWLVDFYQLSIATEDWDGQQWEGINLPHDLELGMSEEEVAQNSPEAERIDYIDDAAPFSAFLWEDGTIASISDGAVRSIWMKPKLCVEPQG